jgi:hypothetical protein
VDRISLTRVVDAVLNAPIKRPDGLRCVGTNGDPTDPVWAVREPPLQRTALPQGREACDETWISHRRFAYQNRVGACVS